MSRRSGVCRVPSCGRNIVPEEGDDYPQGNIMRQLCSRCNASRYYWRRREHDDPEAVEHRRERLKFFSTRLGWLFDKGGID